MPDVYLAHPGLPGQTIRVEVPEHGELSREYARAGWEPTDPPAEPEPADDPLDAEDGPETDPDEPGPDSEQGDTSLDLESKE